MSRISRPKDDDPKSSSTESLETPTASAVRSLGTATFPAAFARVASSTFQADQVIVFRVDGPSIRTLLARNLREGTDRAVELAESYSKKHWAKDPNRNLLLPANGPQRDVVLRATRVEDIEDRAYRQSLFVEPELGGKASLVVREPDHALYLNLYRGVDRKPFAAEEMELIRLSRCY